MRNLGERGETQGKRAHGPPTSFCAAILLLSIFLLLAGQPSVSRSAETPLIRFIVQWVPQAQFAGYYMALEEGLYDKRGLNVTFLRGGPDRNPEDLIRNGGADIGTFFLTGALTARDRGLPLVHLAQVVNQSNLMLVAWKNKGIKRVEDLNGRRISLWGQQFNSPFMSVFKRRGINPVIVPQYYTVNLFLKGGVDACAAMHYNEYHIIYQAGVDEDQITPLFMRDLGAGVPEDGLYCLGDFYKKYPEACRAFAEVSLEGWKRAAAAPDAAVKIVMRYARSTHTPTNEAHTRWMLNTILRTIIPGQGDTWKLGELSMQDYRKTADILEEQGLIQRAPSYWVFRGQEMGHVP